MKVASYLGAQGRGYGFAESQRIVGLACPIEGIYSDMPTLLAAAALDVADQAAKGAPNEYRFSEVSGVSTLANTVVADEVS
jgi:hypothetical protein